MGMINKKEVIAMAELPTDVAGGIYSDFALINHSSEEFVIDFLCRLPGMPKPRVQSRIIMSPIRAKQLMSAIGEAVNAYEQQFGKIEPRGGHMQVPIGDVQGEA